MFPPRSSPSLHGPPLQSRSAPSVTRRRTLPTRRSTDRCFADLTGIEVIAGEAHIAGCPPARAGATNRRRGHAETRVAFPRNTTRARSPVRGADRLLTTSSSPSRSAASSIFLCRWRCRRPGARPPSVSGRRSRFAAQRLRHRPSLTTPDWVDPPYSVLATPRVRTLVRPTQPGATVSGPEDSFSRIIPVHCMGSNTSRTNDLEQSPGHFGPRDRLATHAPTHLRACLRKAQVTE